MVIIIFIDYCLPSNPQMTCHSSVSPVILNLTPSNSQLTSESLRIQYRYSLMTVNTDTVILYLAVDIMAWTML